MGCEEGCRAGERRQKAKVRERCCVIKGDGRGKDRLRDVDREGEMERKEKRGGGENVRSRARS